MRDNRGLAIRAAFSTSRANRRRVSSPASAGRHLMMTSCAASASDLATKPPAPGPPRGSRHTTVYGPIATGSPGSSGCTRRVPTTVVSPSEVGSSSSTTRASRSSREADGRASRSRPPCLLGPDHAQRGPRVPVAARNGCYVARVPRRPDRGRSRGDTAVRVGVLVVLLTVVFALLQLNDKPGIGISIYALLPIVLAVFWFGLPGGLLTGAGALGIFLVDQALTPAPDFTGSNLAWAIVNRGLLFFAVPLLVTVLLQRERRMAREIEEQRARLAELEALRAALTPAVVPPTPGLDVATAFVPAEGDVAGDFFLVVAGPSGATTIVVGDVVGHGLAAARGAAFLRATMATFAHFTDDPAELLRLADTALRESTGDGASFVTAVCLTIGGTPDREVRWATAGHPAPWVLDTGDSLGTGAATRPLGVGLGEPAVPV